MKKQLSLLEQLQYSTARIEGENKEGHTITGTGFFFKLLDNPSTGTSFPVMITNKHVVETIVKGSFFITLANKDGDPDDSLQHKFGVPNFNKTWIHHPDSNIDLCVLPIASYLNYLISLGKTPFYRSFEKEFLPTEEQLEELDAIEDIIMIGYPNGIWDNVNNQPIIRRGITATHPNKNYMGRKEFMADIAAFPGSSGSPILICNSSSYTDKRGNTYFGKSRLLLLGVLYAGPQHITTGEIAVVPASTSNKPISIHRIPNNLGVVIKSEMILDFERLFEERLKELNK